MILITLGTQDKPFDRLLKEVQKLIDEKVIKDKVVVQAGHTKFKSKDMEIYGLIPIEEFSKLIATCDLLITHGGVGSIIDGLKNNKKVIAVPRLGKYNEAVNDHQLQIIENFDKAGYIIGIKDTKDLKEALIKTKTFKPNKYESNTEKFISIIENNIESDIKKKINIKPFLSIGFILIIILILLISGIYSLKQNLDINYYENRMAYKYEKLSLDNILNKKFQDSVENTLSDQLPKSIIIKKIYNFGNALLTKKTTDLLVGKYCDNNYINYNGILTFGCNGNLVYSPLSYEDNYDNFENRISNINNVIKNSKKPVYIYYIEKDNDINFKDNIKTNMSHMVKEKINIDKFYIYEINSFNEFTENFYKTDHHWNHKGSYKGYVELHDFLGLKDDVLIPINEECHSNKWAGSKANMSGSQYIYGEKLCSYKYELNNYDVIINGVKTNDIGYNNIFDIDNVTYGGLYGWDAGEIILDFNQPKKENILLIGESYDNAILKLIGSHYNKTFAVDLRHYKDENNKDFKLNEYIKENNIDKVVLIGNYGYFSESIFNIEV